NDIKLSKIELKKKKSLQKFKQFSKKEILENCTKLINENPKLYSEIKLVSLKNINIKEPICDINCEFHGKNFSCPPFSTKIDLSLWANAILWEWKCNNYKKYRYNLALKKIHGMIYSLGYYFALSFRDCYCDECLGCTYPLLDKPICEYRKILSPSMQSQGIDPKLFGNGKYGLELF
ncbi:unnamed protein product, partial [marine sediment metagenome]